MLIHPITDKLQQLRLYTIANILKEQINQPAIESLRFEERLGLLVDMEITARENRRLQIRLRKAKLKHDACFEDINYEISRGLDKSLLATLSHCQWVQSHHNILIVGPTGTGKTFLACALTHKACLLGFSANYHRLSRLLSDLQLSRNDGSYNKRLEELTKIDILILDDFGLTQLTHEQCYDLLELLDNRHEKCATIVTSQIPIKLWYETMGNETLADAILDRLIHNAYRLEMNGESMRKVKFNQTQEVK